MAATTADGNKVDEVVSEKGNVDEVVGEKSKMITLVSSDGQRFNITREAAAMSQTINHMIEDDCVENGVLPLPNVRSKILAMVIEYCNKHVHVASSSDASTTSGEQADLKRFDEKFIKVAQATLFDIVIAANYLDIKGLMDLSCQTVADMIKGKSVEDFRKRFNIKNDFAPEEEEVIRRENHWAFE